jgi:hypothetical protein
MSREYLLSAAAVTLANQAVTLAFVNPGVSASLEFTRAWASQAANATSAQQRIQLSSQVTAFPTLVSATPTKNKLSDPASLITGGTTGAAGTAGVNASAEGAGTKTILYPDSFNVLNGWLWVPTPSETIIMNASGASGLGLHFPAAPTTLTSWSGGLGYREL